MIGDLSLFLVFAAGTLSFLSPCVLPLIPSYLSILGGLGLNRNLPDGQQTSSRSGLVRTSAAFIIGFSAVFVTLGILVSATFALMGGIVTYINRAAGIIVIVLGINVIFDFISFLNYEKRPFLQKGFAGGNFSSGSASTDAGNRRGFRALGAVPAAFIAGAAFAVGWTPCIGPVLTTILLMAGQSGKTGIAAGYLVLYSAGLGLPFFLAALFFDSFMKHSLRLRKHMIFIRRISGIILIIIGIMILFGQYSALNVQIQRLTFIYIDWAQAQAFPFRLLGRALAWIQNF